jgi:hypothetical protein
MDPDFHREGNLGILLLEHSPDKTRVSSALMN